MSLPQFMTPLKALIQGLWFPSDTEAPWTIPTWTLSSLAAADICRVLRRAPTDAIEEISLEMLLQQVWRRCQRYGDEGQAIAQQHQALAHFLKDHCQQVRVLRVGQVTIDILLVGQIESGYVVLQTQSVET